MFKKYFSRYIWKYFLIYFWRYFWRYFWKYFFDSHCSCLPLWRRGSPPWQYSSVCPPTLTSIHTTIQTIHNNDSHPELQYTQQYTTMTRKEQHFERRHHYHWTNFETCFEGTRTEGFFPNIVCLQEQCSTLLESLDDAAMKAEILKWKCRLHRERAERSTNPIYVRWRSSDLLTLMEGSNA